MYIKYFLILFLLFGIGKNTLLSVTNLPQIMKACIEFIPMELCEYTGYFVLGYWLASRDFKINKGILLLFYLIAVVTTAILSQKISIMIGKPLDAWYSFLGVFTFVEACSLFLYFKSFNITSELISTVIRIIADCSFGIYLMHIFVLNFIADYLGIDALSFNPIIWILVFSLFVFCICLLFVLVLKKIPVLKKWCV